MKRLGLLSIILLAACCIVSCSTATKLKKAHRTFESGGYYDAAKMYSKLYGNKKLSLSEKTLVNFRMGESYRILNNLSSAERPYERAINNKNSTIDEAYLRLGEVQLMTKKYDKALASFNTYKERVPNDPRADRGIASVQLAKEQSDKNKDIIVENLAAANSTSNDYAPAFGTADFEMLLFTSSRSDGKNTKKKQPGTGQRPSAIFYIQQEKNGWTKPKMLGDEVNGKKDEDGTPMFNDSFDRLYYTKSVRATDGIEGCTIYTAIRDHSYNWEPSEPLLDGVDSIMMAHPSISYDGLTLYFVSNMPGGVGGLDIWKMTRKATNEDWGEPINLGTAINTKNNEMYPFIRANGELYFASDGHIGYGGLDIFKATPNEYGAWQVENMGPPFNTEMDDFAIIFEPEYDNGYFSSRRKGGKGGDDIYRFHKNIPVVEYISEGIVLDTETKKPIVGADVKLMGNNGSVLMKKTEKDGTYRFKLMINTDYIVIASAKDYLNQKALFSTYELKGGHTFTDTLKLMSTAKPIEIPNIFFAYGKADLNNESRDALDKLVDIMRDNPDIVVELAAHTDSKGSNQSNLELSQKRAQAVVDYLIHDGIDEHRMVAKGYGEDYPKVVDKKIAARYKFLGEGQLLTEEYINKLSKEEYKEAANQLNRRTELIVIKGTGTAR